MTRLPKNTDHLSHRCLRSVTKHFGGAKGQPAFTALAGVDIVPRARSPSWPFRRGPWVIRLVADAIPRPAGAGRRVDVGALDDTFVRCGVKSA
jgi:hypothetical protein